MTQVCVKGLQVNLNLRQTLEDAKNIKVYKHDANPKAKVLKECLGTDSDWADLWRACGCDEQATTHVPIIVHEDGVPHFSGAPAHV